MMSYDEIVSWLLDGDPAIQYQVHRDLLGEERSDIRRKITEEGWGKAFLENRQTSGHWGRSFYNPKWISTHYTLLDLKNLAPNQQISEVTETLEMVFREEKGNDGGIFPAKSSKRCDLCVNGMVLNYSSYFKIPEENLHSVVDFILKDQMDDGGFNCNKHTPGARHSSLHSTLSTIEGFAEYQKQGYLYRLEDIQRVQQECEEFILQHRLFKSDKTGEIIHPRFLKLTYPCRWFYDILRALDYFQDVQHEFDERMSDALEVLIQKRRRDGRWNVQAKHAGQVHFNMETAGKASRWNTLRALRIMKMYHID